jgi:hypothetical protein
MECIDPYDDIGIFEEYVLLEEPKGEPVLSDYQFRGRDHWLESSARRWREPGCCRRPPITLG